MSGIISYQDAGDGVLNSPESHPVDFDLAWQWVGYRYKTHAKRTLEANFLKALDFEVFTKSGENPRGGRPVEQISLTLDCFKAFCMLAGTPKGKEVRLYFIKRDAELTALEKTAALQRLAQNESTTVPHYNVLSFLERFHYGRWRSYDLILIGIMARRLSRAMRVPWRYEAHPQYGSIGCYPLRLLLDAYDHAAEQIYHDQRRRLPFVPEELEQEAFQ